MANQIPCHACTKTFTIQKDLESHCNSVHKIYGKQCRHCKLKYDSVASLLQHQVNSHGGINRGNSEGDTSPSEAGNTTPGGGGSPTATAIATSSAGDGGNTTPSGSSPAATATATSSAGDGGNGSSPAGSGGGVWE
ncbi:hypothetical protein ACOSQ3_005407 [Xanthoceras sorbifolium]